MSGPKISNYTLTAEQRRRLAEQRELERRKSIAAETIQRESKRLQQIGSRFTAFTPIADELTKRTGTDGGFHAKLDALEEVVRSVSAVKTYSNDLSVLENGVKTIATAIAKAESISSILSDIAANNELKLQSSLQTEIDRGFEASFTENTPMPNVKVNDLKSKIQGQLTQMKNSKNLSDTLIAELEDALKKTSSIEDEIFLKNFFALSVAPLLKHCRESIREYETYHEDFEKLYTEYTALCRLSACAEQSYSCSAASVAALKVEIQRLKREENNADEQAYICDSLDAVMVEMGYAVLGHREVTKRSGKHFRNELYSYSDGTAVNITYSSDGQIAMELGGIDTSDRLPTAQETEKLCESMEHFCHDFKEIEKRLLARGIVPEKRISLLPPTADYAQIINTADYNMQKSAESIHSEGHRKRAAGKQIMHRD